MTAFGDLIRVPMGSLGAPGICAQVFMTFEKAQTGLMSFKEYLAFMSLAKVSEMMMNDDGKHDD